ncbi:MAG: AAA family ATPase [Cyanobacteria bacterium P01_G01_bin.67]
MISLADYQISVQIHQSNNSVVYRGKRKQDDLPVIIKVLRQDYPTPTQITRYKQEYQITHNLAIPGVVKAYSLEKYQNTLVIIFEDFGGESLKILTERKQLTLREFLPIAISITVALGNIHTANIIHKDINPSNIVYNLETQELKIIDFGISTRLIQENLTLKNPDILEGTLAYIAPEQTGRMNRLIDYRSDFYSLGVTFYELLTGRLPFETEDSLELIYCHLAKQAIPPHELAPLPQVISDIVMKLMAKAAEDGYQSAWGIQADLESCLQQLETTGVIEDFPVATQDIVNQFQIPQKLYGREKEIETLLALFRRISAPADPSSLSLQSSNEDKSETELLLISGYSGIGKSALVKEIYQPITAKKGYFISGKFDQYQRDIPYYAVIQAFKKLIEQLLTESEARLKTWQDKLQGALGVNGQVIVDIIPEVALIIGKQSAIPKLQPTEAQNRFNLVFQNFIQVFDQSEHPLVIFLDDLQWADLASLKLMKLLINAPDINSLLLIGAYRDNEVNAAHPLMLTVEEIKESGTDINQISLNPLTLADLNQFVADTLCSSESVIKPLAKLLHTKTNGNPFFMREFLKSLYYEKLLKFDLQSLNWQWNLAQIKAQQITNNVVELMVQKIQNLPNSTQEILKLSSCIGNQFDIETLAMLAETSPTEAALFLHDAIAQGLVLPLSDFYKSVELDTIDQKSSSITKQVEYKFVHDRIQQAAYSLIPQVDKSAQHLQIGRLLLQHIPESEQEENIFNIVNQFNKAIELITEQSERNELAKLNLIAGKKAKASAAYQSAFNYLQISIKLLAKNSWHTNYRFTLNIYNSAAEYSYLSGEFLVMENLFSEVLKQAKTVLDKISIYETKIQAHIAQSQPKGAINSALEILKLLGINFPRSPKKIHFLLALIRTKLALSGRQIESLGDLPRLSDRRIIIIMRILNLIFPFAYLDYPKLFVLIALKIVNLSLKYGNSSESILGYCMYAVLLCGFLGDINSSFKFAELALNLLDRIKATKEIRIKVIYTLIIFIKHRKVSARETYPDFLESYQNALEIGDFEYAAYSIASYCFYCYDVGEELGELEKKIHLYSNLLTKLNQKVVLEQLYIYRRAILNLINTSDKNEHLTVEMHDKGNLTVDKIVLHFFYLNELIVCYIFSDYFQALKNAYFLEDCLQSPISTPDNAVYLLYSSLARLATYDPNNKISSSQLIRKVTVNQKKLKKWAHYAPMNYQHKYYLVEAEKCRVLGKISQAEDLYIRAIDLACKNKYLNDEALAYELTAKFYLVRGHNLVAATYIKQARYCYLKWGAKAKVEHLDENYPELLATVVSESTEKNPIITSSSTNQEALDLNTLIKTSQALAQITDFSQLLETLIKFVLENAGAEKGYLVLVQAGNFIIQGSGAAAEIVTLQALPVDSCQDISQTIINYVYRTQENLVLDNASSEGLFINDEYIINNEIKSVLCLPILNQGKLIGILYLENNLAEKAFTAERLEILKLISTQVAVSIENALLRQQKQEKAFEYQVGGCLTIDAPTYVIRQADTDLYQNLKQGHYCYILNSRHMGKSSLRVRIMNKLQKEGIICVAVDLTMIGSQKTTIEQWYAGVIYRLVNSLKLADKFDFRSWWCSLDLLSPVQRFSEFIEQILLREIRGRIIIFIDEIDSVLSLSFRLDDFFAVIRACYNNRNDYPEYQRLNFVLLGVATSASLIQDKYCTPFNIGNAIALQGFQLHEVKPLTEGLASKFQNPQALIKQVLAWTGGQPFLTQKICSLMLEVQIPPTEGMKTEWIDHLIQGKIIDNWESKDDPQHFKTIRDRLLNSSDPIRLLQLYQQILDQAEVIVDDSKVHKELLLSGLVKQEGSKFLVYNCIYQSVFDLAWCEKALDSLYR